MTLSMRGGRYPGRRWDPFGMLPGFDDLFDQMSRMLTNSMPDVARVSVQSWSPPVDIQETDDAYAVEADVPGVRPEDVAIELEGRELRITGEYGTVEDGDGDAQQTRRSGRFDYRITLPSEVNTESTTANLDNGVLRLQLPKASSSRRQRITVQSRAGDSGQAPRQAPGGQNEAGSGTG